MTQPTTSPNHPDAMLSGVRVLDMTSVVFGPYATRILSDLGAEVIKVEPPEGDAFRLSGKPAKSPGMSPGHHALNAGKQSIALDLKEPEDAATMRDLVATSDMFIHNVRKDAIQRLGLGLEDVRKINPNIIYIHCVGFGSDGPYGDLQAYDDVIQAASGTATLAGQVDGSGAARYLPSLIADKVAGLHGAQAALAAYIHKLRTGESQFVEVPMFEAFTQFMLVEHLAGLTFDPPNAPACYARQIDPDRQPFPTADGYISIVPYTPSSWPIVFDVLGDPDFLQHPERNTPALQFRNQDQLYQRTAELTPARSTQDWLERFRAARIPCMAVRDISLILDDPHLQATGFFRRREHPSEGTVIETASPIRFERYQPGPSEPAPHTGEHGDTIRESLANHIAPPE
nr:CoA transferase [uncultured Hyphomonas sp.]